MCASASSSPATLDALTEAEEGLWYAQRRDPGNPIFNTGQYVEMTGPLDRGAFRRAVDGTMREAGALAVRFVESADGPRRLRDEAARASLVTIDCRAEAEPRAAALTAIDRDMHTPLDLSRDPPAVQHLYVLAADHHLWYQRIHHVVIDGYGTGLLIRRICDCYRAAVAGKAPSGLPFGDPSRVDAEDAEYRGSDQRVEDRHFWMSTFDDRPEVIGMCDGPAVTAHSYLTHAVTLSEPTSAALQRVAARGGVSWPDVLTTLIGAYVQRHIGGAEAIVGVPAMLRVGSAAARVPTMAMNVLPLRINADESRPIAELYRSVAAQLQQSLRHGRYRSEQLRRDLGLLGDQRRLYGPLINVLPFDAPIDLPEITSVLQVIGTGPVDDLTVTIRADAAGAGLRLELDANPTLYSERTLGAHARRLAAFLERALGVATLAEVPTVTASEHQSVIDDVNATDHAVEDTTLTALIERAMRRSPASTAVVCEAASLTYAELDGATAIWAGRLAELGVRRGDFVAVCIPRSLELEIALVAVLRAGAAYLPIDAEYPAERVRAITAIAQPKAVLLSGAPAVAWPDSVAQLRMDQPPAQRIAQAIEDARPDDPAYIIFTSGSTGAPKGVVIQHRAIVNRLEWMRQHYGFDASDRILQKTPATFDVSVWEFFLPLIAGGTLVMAPPEAHRDPHWLTQLIRGHAITTLHFVPSMLAEFLAEPAAKGLAIERIVCSGEALPAALRDRMHQTLDAELHNLYGPTEAAVDVSYWDASYHDRQPIVPIGFPVWNTRLYILDSQRRPVPIGAPGDLYIAGVQLAREYLGRPDLTSERFVPDPFAGGSARMYLTGDVARRREDGAIEYLGRSDFQVKLRGLRIELGEIESVLRTDSAVADAAVVVREDRAGDQRLVAYVTARDQARPPDTDTLVRVAQQTLPGYMVPGAIVVLESFPLGATGKLDRKQLPVPPSTVVATGRTPSTATERQLAGHFALVLGLAALPAASEDFFALGGHSLLAVQLVRRLNEAWPVHLGLGAIFEHPTVTGLAARIDAAVDRRTSPSTVGEGLGVMLKLADGPSGSPALFCIHPAGGLSWCYGVLARALAPSRVYGVQARSLDPRHPLPRSLRALAEDYVGEIRRLQPQGPYHLAGWSVGGIIGHAMAEVIESIGERMGTLAMLDSYPCDRWRDAPPPDDGVALKALLLMAGLDPSRTINGPLTRHAVVAMLRASSHPLGQLADDTISGIIRGVEHNSELVRHHRHGRVAVKLLHFRAALDHQDTDLSPLEWQPYVGGLEIHDIPSLHPHMTAREQSLAIAGVLARSIGQ